MENIDKIKLFAKVFGKSLFEKIPITPFFDRAFLKTILKRKIDLEDFLLIDEKFYQSMKFLLETDLSNEDLEEYFVIYDSHTKSTFNLRPNGASIKLCNENKEEFVALSIAYHSFTKIQPILNIFLPEFYRVIPLYYVDVFEPEEFELMINGTPQINLEEWRSNTIYKGVYNPTHEVINWFWSYLGEFSQEKLSALLKFCTGSPTVPIEGFRNLESNRGSVQKFCIESRAYKKNDAFPKAHTCFNRLELPIYPTRTDLQCFLNAVLSGTLDGVFGME